MSKAYPSAATASNGAINTQLVKAAAPIDDRFSVDTLSDLYAPNTFAPANGQNPWIYDGMIVAVVYDNTSANNGLYWLPDTSYQAYQSWDESAANYNANGWRRLADNVSGSQVYLDKRIDNESDRPGSFAGTGTQDDPYYIKTINGGIITVTV